MEKSGEERREPDKKILEGQCPTTFTIESHCIQDF
jgi:hypothetical protein